MSSKRLLVLDAENRTPSFPANIVQCDMSSGLTVSCKFGVQCRVPLSELSEPGIDIDAGRFAPGQIIDCYLAKKPRHGAVILSLKPQA